MNDIELLQYVHETAEMGIEGLNSLDGQVRDDSLRRVLSQQGAEYRQIADQAERLLRSLGEEPRDPGLLAKVSAEVMSTFKTLADPSASNIAEMVIQGNTMGATKSTRHLGDYAGGNREIRNLAERLLHTEEANAAQMKQFLYHTRRKAEEEPPTGGSSSVQRTGSRSSPFRKRSSASWIGICR